MYLWVALPGRGELEGVRAARARGGRGARAARERVRPGGGGLLPDRAHRPGGAADGIGAATRQGARGSAGSGGWVGRVTSSSRGRPAWPPWAVAASVALHLAVLAALTLLYVPSRRAADVTCWSRSLRGQPRRPRERAMVPPPGHGSAAPSSGLPVRIPQPVHSARRAPRPRVQPDQAESVVTLTIRGDLASDGRSWGAIPLAVAGQRACCGIGARPRPRWMRAPTPS